MIQLTKPATRRLPVALLALILFILAVSLPAHAADVIIEGRVLTEAGPLANASVSAYRSYADLQDGSGPVAFATSNNDGLYRLNLPPGSYFFTANGESDGRRFHAYHGSNPLTVANETFWLGLLATPRDLPPAYTDGPTSLEGIVTYKGKPLSGAYLALYKPDSKSFKGLGVRTESIGADGRFRLNLQPGSYVVTARNIENGKSNRPLQQGDLYCYFSGNPVEVKPDRRARIEMSCYPKGNRDNFVATRKIKSDVLNTYSEQQASSKSGIRGIVTDQTGQPVAGMNVLAYRLTTPVFMMYHVYHGSEHSSLTDKQGRFFIPLDSDGDYGLVARDTLGDGPHRGELYGLYQGNVRHAVSLKQGQTVENVSIIVGRVMDDSGQSPAEAAPQVVVGTTDGNPVVLSDTVITRDTVWQGEIIIQGVVAVKRGTTLLIRPGTTVRFRKTDRDNNDVGDGEILVEGRLIARGTPENRIVFTSAEDKPAAGDWSYLQFLASNRGNIIEHCQFEYAFAGVMIHYADVKIRDTLFRNNNRGLHYNTADLDVDHSTFVNNRIGIRFMRMEGNVRITNNHITRNDIGVLFVRQHVNAVNFEQLNRGQDIPAYQGNNIHANRNYNFSLGEEQERDIKVSGNWWGTPSSSAIAELMYDRSKNPTVSRIQFEPFLETPVTGAGVRGLSPEFIFKSPEKNDSGGDEPPQAGVLSGRFLMADDRPLSGALLYLYNLKSGPLPSLDRYWRVPNHSAEIGADGRFSIQAPPGLYSIGAIKRSNGLYIGPPELDDLFMLYLDETGQPRAFSLKPGALLNLGDIREPALSSRKKDPSEAATSIEGVITDLQGKPLEGVLVFAFTRPTVVGKPLFVSQPSDARGHFRLALAEGGTYYLKARSNLGGGPPQTGLIIDGNKLEPLVKVSVSTGETSGGVVLKTKTFPGRGRKK